MQTELTSANITSPNLHTKAVLGLIKFSGGTQSDQVLKFEHTIRAVLFHIFWISKLTTHCGLVFIKSQL